jgi:hypothetical protein
MPLTTTDVLTEKNFLPCGEVMRLLAAKGRIDSSARPQARSRPGAVLSAETDRRARRIHRRADEPAFLRHLQQDAADRRRQGASVFGQSHRSGFARGIAERRGRRSVEGIAGNRAAIETAGTPVPRKLHALPTNDRHRRLKNHSSKQEREESQVSLWTGQSSTPTTVWVRLHQK